MLKPVVAGIGLLALAGSSFVYAQQGFGGHGGYGDGGSRQHRHLSAADVSAFADARIAALKAGLELTPDQVKNWPPFEQAVRDMVQLRIQRIQARQSGDQQPTSPFDRMERRADNMSMASAALKKVADAGAPLYQSLDDTQKARFMQLARILRPHHHMHASNDGQGQGGGRDGQGWGHGRRFGQNGGPGGRMQNLSGSDGDQGSKL